MSLALEAVKLAEEAEGFLSGTTKAIYDRPRTGLYIPPEERELLGAKLGILGLLNARLRRAGANQPLRMGHPSQVGEPVAEGGDKVLGS